MQGCKLDGVYVKDVAGIVQRLATRYGKAYRELRPGGSRCGQPGRVRRRLPAAGRVVRQGPHECAGGLPPAGGERRRTDCHVQGWPAAPAPGWPCRPPGAPRAITLADYDQFSLSLKTRSTVRAGVKVGFCRNWTVQNNLETGIPEAHKTLFGQEWLTASASDAAVAANLPAAQRPGAGRHAAATCARMRRPKANRRLALWKVPRHVYAVRCYGGLPDARTGPGGDAVQRALRAGRGERSAWWWAWIPTGSRAG
ncbi:hypothetical protein ACU4GD_28175 [Cupriavidus basilensis]